MTSIACPPDETTTVTRSPSAPTTDQGQRTKDILARNRRNAQRSTGPRTPEGRKRSAQNATTHALCTAAPPPDLQRDPDFQQAKAELVEEYRPTTPTQVVLLNQLAHLTWKLDQIPRLERQLLATPLGQSAPTSLATDAVSPADHAPPADPTVELTAHHLLQDRPTPLTRLWDHHRRLLARTQSVVRQLLHLRAHHQKRRAEDAALEAALAQSERADRANAAERAFQLRQRHLEEERRAAAAGPAQTGPVAPEPATTCHPDAPAQNEPTPPGLLRDPFASFAPSRSSPPAPAHPGATPRNKSAHLPPPAQNEPTTDQGQRTTDQGQRTKDQEPSPATTFSPPDLTTHPDSSRYNPPARQPLFTQPER